MSASAHLSRRSLLRWSAGALLSANLWPGRLAAADADSGAFDFLVINDIHSTDAEDGKFMEMIIASMKAQKASPEFCLIAGDLSEHGRAAQLALVRDIFKTLGIPVHVVCGNHDYEKGKGTERPAYLELFPNQLNYTFEHKGWQFVGLDTTDGTKADVTILEPTLKWADQAAPRLDRRRPTALFTHFPLGPKVKYRPPNADDLLDKFKGLNLSAVFGGHFHGYTRRTIGPTVLTTNRCCSLKRLNHDGTKEKGYFLCAAKDGQITPTFVQMTVPDPTRPIQKP